MDRIVVLDTYGIMAECLYYGYEKGKLIRKQRRLLEGQILEVIKIARFIPGVGWFVQVLINHSETEYIHLKTIEKAIIENKAMYVIDFEIELNLLSFLLNKAFDERDKSLFFNRVNRYNKLINIRKKVEAELLQKQ